MRLEKQSRDLWLTKEEVVHLTEVVRVIRDLKSALQANQLDGLYLYNKPILVGHLDLIVDKLELLCGLHGKELS